MSGFFLPLVAFSMGFSMTCFAQQLPKGGEKNPVENLTLEEKIGQLFMVCFKGETANENARTLVQDTKVGGIIYYNWANGLSSPEQVRDLSKNLQKLAQIPLLIAADQEGGRVARLKGDGFTKFPPNLEVESPHHAGEIAYSIGQELRDVGINMNLAPVVDVNSNPQNPVIGNRSYGDSPESVAACAREALEGYKKVGVISTLKHFPGHGDTSVDSHVGLPVIHKSMEELEKTELFPFKELGKVANAIMTAHILVPSFDEEFPATLSEKTLSYLREKIGFQGVIVADSLVMQGVLDKAGSVEEAAIQAINAGCDLLIFGGRRLNEEQQELSTAEIQQIHQAVVKAALHGRIPMERINDAAQRVLSLKN